VLAHRLLGGGAVAGRDRRDDPAVLGERLLGAARSEHGAELEADHLGVQAGADVARDGVAGDLEDAPVHDGVALGHREQLAAGPQGLHLVHERHQLARLVLGTPQCGVAGRERLERGACLEDLDRLVDGEAADARAAVALAHDEALVAEAQDRLAHGAAADAEPLRELLLDQPLAGRQLACHDGRVEGGIRAHGREHTKQDC
jgi:hypothetical protein